MEAERDLIVVGGGAAGLAAAQYGARGGLRVLLLEEMASGGQALVIDTLENYPGFPRPLTGFEFTQRMEEQAAKFGAEIMNGSVRSMTRKDGVFALQTDQGSRTSLSVIVATGAKHRRLGIPGENEFSGRGVSCCATCDGPFFKGKRMIVVGGGDAACDEAMFLSKLASRIILLHRKDRFRAQAALSARVLANPIIEVRFHSELLSIQGDKAVREVRILDNVSGKRYGEPTEAVFVFVGSIPRTEFLSAVDLDEGGYVRTDQRMASSIPGLFAAGDVRASPFRQIVVAAAEGAIAAHSAGQYIDEIQGKAYR
jgi:thioredoxin reductase (NADPH)